ncbi:MAG TPA: hypothetical protein VF607_03180 [Verrucomicrobiae bacterium]
MLNLIWDYPGDSVNPSRIAFSGVVTYHFTHTGTAVITDIEELPLAKFIDEFGEQLAELHHLYGIAIWHENRAKFMENLQQKGCRAWEITSAIGFYGIVVAQSVAEVT